MYYLIVYVYQSGELETTLVGHTGDVTSANFSPHHSHTTLITVSQDRTFKVNLTYFLVQ